MAAALLLAWLAMTPEAGADAIAPSPACPPGSRGKSSHAGQWCAAASCETDDDCKQKGAICKQWRVCVREAMVTHHRRARSARVTEQVVGTCAPEKACKGDEEPPPPLVGQIVRGPPICTTGRYCVPGSLPPLPPPEPDEEEDEEDEETDEEDEGEKDRGASASTKEGCGCGCRSSKAPAHATLLVFLASALLLIRRRPRS